MHAALGIVLVLLPGLFFLRGRRTFQESRDLPLRVGFSLLVLLYSLLQASGGEALSPLSPALYLVLALLASLQPLWQGLSNAALCAALSAVHFWMTGAHEADVPRLVGRIVFYAFFSLGVGALLGWERGRRKRLENVLRHLQSDRQELRRGSVLAPGGGGAKAVQPAPAAPAAGPALPVAIESDLESLARYLEKSFVTLLERLSKILPCRTCALYLTEGEGPALRLREALSRLELDGEARVLPGQGLLGWVLENASPVLLAKFDPVRHQLPYYRSRQDVGSFAAVPVPGEAGPGEGPPGGILCADAPVEDALTGEHLQILQLAAGQVAEILSNARNLRRVHEEKREFEGLYGFSARLSNSLRAEDLSAGLLAAASQILSFDLGAVVLGAAGAGSPTVRVARGAGAESLEGRAIAARVSRAGWVIETGQTLPLARRATAPGTPLFFAKEKLPHLESAVLIPFASLSPEGVLGCLVLAFREEKRVGPFELRLLELLCRQAAAALLNARLFERMEALATTDGLTGLCNHRTFQERLDVELKRAERTGAPLCLALTDIDFFKKFNDTYGHPVGDAVLRHLSRIYAQGVRGVDLVARYGGEEFVILFPETPLEKAREVCERLRTLVARSRLQEGPHELSVTISLGLAAWPAHAAAKGALIECADQALYRAKREGRNRVVVYDPKRDAGHKAGEEIPVLTAVHAR